MSREISSDRNDPAVFGENTASGVGVSGRSNLGVGVHGENVGGNLGPDRGVGVWGESQNGFGVFGSSDNHRGIRGVSRASVGVNGINDRPAAIQPDRGCGLHGESVNGFGVYGASDTHEGVRGTSTHGEGVHAETRATAVAALAAFQMNPDSNSAAIFAKHAGNRAAGVFEGNVFVSGTVEARDFGIVGADCAEDFDVTEQSRTEPGTVMVIGADGALRPCRHAYDRRVAGVISGAGRFRTGITLDKKPHVDGRKPLALIGKAYCKVDATYGSIDVGDLLTTSNSPGYAMKAVEPSLAFGAVIGKALAPLERGRCLIPILVTLQ